MTSYKKVSKKKSDNNNTIKYLFKTSDNRWLIPTAEVPLTNIVANSIINNNVYNYINHKFTFLPSK